MTFGTTEESRILNAFGLGAENPGAFAGRWLDTSGERIESVNPATGKTIAAVTMASPSDYQETARVTEEAFHEWRTWPAPRRGEVVRLVGDRLRHHKDDLGRLVSLEVGKILSEGLGEVQEMIDMADLAVGMSRQLFGLTMHSERPQHRMYEQWHPIGPVGIITAFNFPVAVWAWNALVAAVCGNSMVWKPSPEAPLTSLAVTRIAQEVLEEVGAPPIFNLVIGGVEGVGEALVADRRFPLISATGSVRMGREVGAAVASRMGTTLLELGGNNGLIVMDDADPDLVLRAVLFGAAGTAGQRCTTTRRLFLHKDIAADTKARLVKAYSSIRIGDPLDPNTLMGPLINQKAIETMKTALEKVRQEGGRLLTGGEVVDRDGFFVKPAIVEIDQQVPMACEETFAPILYVMEFEDFDAAMEMHNAVPQGLSSAIFTLNMRTAERFLSAAGSDCGIANVNIGTSGAEIGGAFGGEKDTGGGREAGSDSWKAYMRRQTCTLNWGEELPLAQGVQFDVD